MADPPYLGAVVRAWRRGVCSSNGRFLMRSRRLNGGNVGRTKVALWPMGSGRQRQLTGAPIRKTSTRLTDRFGESGLTGVVPCMPLA
jgi:hypothetical protein